MLSTFFGLDIGQSGLSAAQVGQDVVGHNISNANTPGYSKETANTVAGPDLGYASSSDHVHAGMIGSGVQTSSITRAQDQYLNVQVRDAQSSQSFQSEQKNALTQVESTFGEPSDTGLANAMSKFYQSFNELANNPEDTGVRSSVVQNAVAVSNQFQNIQQGLTQVGQSLTTKAADDLQSINDYGVQIAQLNVTIRQSTAQSQNANDLMDQRDMLIDKISSLANVTVANKSDGTVNISIGTSDLVVGTDSTKLTQSGLTARGDLQGGELAGVIQAQSQLSTYQTNLNNLAAATIQQVNAVQAGGTGLDGKTYPGGAGLDGSTGVAFFTGTDANSIGVNPALVTNPQKLAAAAIPPPPAPAGTPPPPGDASNATLLAGIESTTLTSGPLSGQTLSNYYQSIVADSGAKTASAASAAASAQANLSHLSQQRDSITGVSTDAEMINMMKYQQAYSSSARFINTVDGMLNTLINGLFSG